MLLFGLHGGGFEVNSLFSVRLTFVRLGICYLTLASIVVSLVSSFGIAFGGCEELSLVNSDK